MEFYGQDPTPPDNDFAAICDKCGETYWVGESDSDHFEQYCSKDCETTKIKPEKLTKKLKKCKN